ncbi:hypothetical protein [Legionella gresilensis]|uniref:hypothetical protein n=1 Tax=Legionella gresilensis TaxID=91823 RepID=UPI001041BC8C|nr:hypothetical protein [Legionella gresilensis]
MYKNFLDGVNQFLLYYGISTKKTDILEETILKIAGIKDKPKRCQFGIVPQKKETAQFSAAYDEETETYSQFLDFRSFDKERMYFAIRGMSTRANQQFLNYLNQYPKAAVRYYFNDEKNAHYFEINSAWALKFFLPKFKEYVEYMDKACDPDLEVYQTKSKDTPEEKAAQLLKPICYLENFLNAEDLPQIDFSWTSYLYKRISQVFINSSSSQSELIEKLAQLKSSVLQLADYHALLKGFNDFKKQLWSKPEYFNHEGFNTQFKKLSDSVNIFVTEKQSEEEEKERQAQIIKRLRTDGPRNLKRYHVRLREWEDDDGFFKARALPRAFSQLSILSKNRLNLPEKIEARIASHIINYHGTSHFGPNKTIHNATIDSEKKLMYAQQCFSLFKSLNGKSAETKEQLYEEGTKQFTQVTNP